MVSPKLREKLQLYISASIHTITVVLLVERQKQQRPIYFVSNVLTEAEKRYPLVEKLAFAVVTTSRKLKPYFDAHVIQILTNYPLEKALQKMDTSGRLLKWAIELSKYEFEVKPRAAIKAQALAEFIVEASYEDKEDDIRVWKVEVDGSSAQTGSGAGVIMTSSEGNLFEYSIKFKFKASKNEAEYEAALVGLRMSIAAGASKVHLQTYSHLVASQLQGAYEFREAAMLKYVTKVKELAAQLIHFQIDLVPSAGNSQADALSMLASSTLQSLTRTLMVEVLEESSITEKEQLPDDEVHAKKVKKDANWYVVMNGELNKKGFTKPLLRCILEWEQEGIMEESHSGICANHIGGKALGVEVLRRGAYWPTLTQDALAYVKKCDKCQKYSPVINKQANDLTPILSPIPFPQWGMYIIGPFTTGSAGRKYLIVAVDYFKKWIEAKPTKYIKAAQSNGQEEAANKLILTGLQRKLDEYKGLWENLIPEVLWANKTIEKESTGKSPFTLAYGADVVVLVEVQIPCLRIQHYEQQGNEKRMLEELDFLPEVRLKAALKLAAQKSRISKAFNKRVKHKELLPGDLFLRRTTAVGRGNQHGKLSANWEGPFIIHEQVGPGEFLLADQEG
ncbi:uncharacterized protein LOC110721126 [Chenopodium quinoa]|uniref:uncharacterized protein LOC110721126 n=1 Tax=Chenopodium quinoa TaxID=63459 RepID=UPI000B7913F1|nr:uncharacterized protein LOC110721126 [Chenopodium quinoa]